MVSPPPTMVTEVTVLLEDVNDETPTFKAAHYVGEVAEGAQYNSPVNLLGDAIPEVYDHDQVSHGAAGVGLNPTLLLFQLFYFLSVCISLPLLVFPLFYFV